MVETPRTATVEVGAEPEVPFASRAEALNNGELQARGGGLEPGGVADFDGTGGRIAFESNGTIKIGTYDLSGYYMGRNDRSFLRYPTLRWKPSH